MSHSVNLNYLSGYSEEVQVQARALLAGNRSKRWLLKKYPIAHSLSSERALCEYAQQIKNQKMRRSSPISKAIYDDKIHIINNALGLHTYVSRVQGTKCE